MEGHKDPFNRRTYPWGQEDPTLLAHYRALGNLRKQCAALRMGDIRFFHGEDQLLGFTRTLGDRKVNIYVNRSSDPWDIPAGTVLLGHKLHTVSPTGLSLAPMGFCITEVE